MGLIQFLMAVSAISMLLLSISLAQGSGVVDVLVNVSPATNFVIPHGTTVELYPPGTDPIATWTGTYTLHFFENSPNDLLVQDSNSQGGHLWSGSHQMANSLQVFGVPIGNNQIKVHTFSDIGEITSDLPLSQVVIWSDPAGVYTGGITLTLSPAGIAS